jgi:hypothetical protein
MKYYKNESTGEVFGFDETDETQLPFMQEKIDAGLLDITDNWPLPPEVVLEEVVDPAEKLKMFLSLNPDVLDLLQ